MLPAVLVCAAVVWQLMLCGAALWASAHAARSAARAAVVGKDAAAAARNALPDLLEPGLRVAREGGAVRVSVRVPLLVPGRGGPVRATSSAGLGPAP